MSKSYLTEEHRRRQRLNLFARGGWTYPNRQALKERGFLWDGTAWLAPSKEELDAAILDLQESTTQEWTLTIHGDAGWKDGTGRWAWFCRSNLPPKLIEGFDQGQCFSVNIAEARAILWGVRAAFAAWPPPSGPGVLFIRSDNMSVINDLQSRSRRMEEIAELLELVPSNLTLNVKHVPAHGKTGGTAGWVNRRVDRASHLRGEEGNRRLKKDG